MAGQQFASDNRRVYRTGVVPAASATIMQAVAAEAVEAELPVAYALSGNYPNPFNPATTIPFALPEASMVKIAVYDLTGRRVAVLVEGELAVGYHTVQFQGGGLASGVYLVRMQAGVFSHVQRMTLVK